MKGQGNILEYALMIFFVMVIIFILIAFLTGFQLFQIDADFRKLGLDRAISLSKHFMSPGYFADEELVLDDARLTASAGLCSELEGVYGHEWFIEARVFDNKQQAECNEAIYPECNYWRICAKNKANISYIFPVNIYRKASGQVALGSLKVGVYR